ncbi:hypothetical protein OE749_03790 [Aestuariibacter sp. AA17]|uniref:Porin domain-containing protein n=1 Tax=Fluctibacter corallii TaxID=2984329 RepID=A0ABT3A6B4_9ALTE|nr:hypothetical protein [Aestuariibacter sp. AA17]MCV2883822.1 hypothetical protein [Aestuariibacter sp. AA17]
MNKITACISLALISGAANAVDMDSIRIHGFGSVVAASVIDGPGYIAEYPNLGTYDEDDSISFSPESRLGIQMMGNISERFSATTQIMLRGANDYDPEIAWAYLTYNVSNEGTLQAGRLRVPVYHFSEYMDVGYAYPWIRIPSDTYSLDLINYNGARYSHNFYIGESTLGLTFSYGNQTNDDDELMSYLFPERIDRDFSDIIGIVANLDLGGIVLRSSYVEAEMLETRHLSNFVAQNVLGLPDAILYPSSTGLTDSDGNSLVAFDTEYDISFFDASVNATFGDLGIFLEYNKYKPFYKSYFGSLTYTFGTVQAYVLYSKFDLDLPWESHDTQSVGLRWDFDTNVALKFDISKFDDTGYNPFTGDPNPVYQPARVENGGDGDGDATIASIGIDFVF